MTLAVHADWSVVARKRWMCVAVPAGPGWMLRVEPVGALDTLLPRLVQEAGGAPVALGVDFPIGLPRAYAATLPGTFPAFLRAAPPPFFEVANTIADAGPHRPFYPRRGVAGMTRLSLAHALGLDSTAGLSRQCDRATSTRPAGAPLFWTLGANQTGKAAISAWLGLLRPALAGPSPPALWPFDGPFRSLLVPGRVTIAETYPAEAMRQLGLAMGGSKRRHGDRLTLMPGLRNAMAGLRAVPDPGLAALLTAGMGTDAAGEDRLDCVLGVLCVLRVLQGGLDTAPPDPWIMGWEGWVLGQAWPAEPMSDATETSHQSKVPHCG